MALSEAEFLSMSPAALDLLLERLAVIDRKANLQIAGLRADYCSVHRNPEKRAEGYTAADFLPELREETEQREREEVEAQRTPTPEEFAAWRNGMLGPQTLVGKLAAKAPAESIADGMRNARGY